MVDIKTINEKGIEVLKIVGEVDASSSIQLDKAIHDVLEKGHKKIIVDCGSLEYISSAGLGVFMSYIEEMKKNGVQMVLVGLNPKVKNVFEILGLDQLLNTAKNKEEGKIMMK
ncbi:MAG: STAS domain-containing protein [Cyclobacteriaceae bacterium]|nr:STAS domain-containing protein [Cyclobacteriaceae bacterium]